MDNIIKQTLYGIGFGLIIVGLIDIKFFHHITTKEHFIIICISAFLILLSKLFESDGLKIGR